jgi:hypothetical protein
MAMIGGHVLAPWRSGWRRSWGARDEEMAAVLPGDDLVPAPTWSYTHAISVDAPPERVWPFVAQLGQERAGFASFERLENLVGCRVHNADGIVDEWQRPVVGQMVHLHPKAPPLRVAVVQPGRSLVLRGADDRDPSPANDNVWSFHVLPDGPGRSRLIERSHTVHGRSLGDRLAFGTVLIEPIGFVMGREMLRGLAALAEGD